MYIVLKIVLNNCSIEVSFLLPINFYGSKTYMYICKNEQMINYLDKTHKSKILMC